MLAVKKKERQTISQKITMKEKIYAFQKRVDFKFNINDILALSTYKTAGSITISILSKVTRPRGLNNNSTASFFEVWCPNCLDKKDSKEIVNAATLLEMEQMETTVISGTEIETECSKCGDSWLIFAIHSLSKTEKDEILNNPFVSMTKQLGYLKEVGKESDITRYQIIEEKKESSRAFKPLHPPNDENEKISRSKLPQNLIPEELSNPIMFGSEKENRNWEEIKDVKGFFEKLNHFGNNNEDEQLNSIYSSWNSIAQKYYDFDEIYIRFGQFLFNNKVKSDAVKIFLKGISHSNKKANVCNKLADLLETSNRNKQSIHYWTVSCSLQISSGVFSNPEPFIHLAHIAKKTDKKELYNHLLVIIGKFKSAGFNEKETKKYKKYSKYGVPFQFLHFFRENFKEQSNSQEFVKYDENSQQVFFRPNFTLNQGVGYGFCLDEHCDCDKSNTQKMINRNEGFLFVSVKNVDKSNTLSEKRIKINQEFEFGEIANDDLKKYGIVAKTTLLCKEGANRRNLNFDSATEDAILWWQGGLSPLRTTPTNDGKEPKDEMLEQLATELKKEKIEPKDKGNEKVICKNFTCKNEILKSSATRFNGKCGRCHRENKNCFIATATYEDIDHPKVILFRKFRDEKIEKYILGKLGIRVYYFISPPLSKLVQDNETLKRFSLKILNRLAKLIEKKKFKAVAKQTV